MALENKTIIDSVVGQKEFLVNTRRYLHENPELSGKEFETSKFLKNECQNLGLEIHDVEGTGFYAILDTGRAGKTIGLRADIDALPVQENKLNLKNNRLCKSKVDGVFHACGHDGHMAISLATARILVKHKDKLNGKVIFIFEEGEETGIGIEKMIKALKKENIDAFYSNHLVSFLYTGKIYIGDGPVMAGCAMVDFTVKGKGGHGSRPDLSISPIFAAANVLTGLASAWANRIDVTKTVTLGLGSINGGSAANVIPDTVNITGTLRYFDLEEGNKAIKVLKKVGRLTSEAHDCEFIPNNISVVATPVINDLTLAKLARKSISSVLGDTYLAYDSNWFASESFSRYGSLAPSLFALVGTKSELVGSGAEHHNEYFDLDEESLYYATCSMVKFASEFLSNK